MTTHSAIIEEVKNNTVSSSHAKEYNKIKLVLSLSETVLSFLFTVVLLVSGFTLRIEALAYSFTQSSYIALFIFGGIIGVCNGVLTFPLSFYSSFMLEHKYNLSNQTFLQWLWERVKGMFVALPIMVPLGLIFYYFLVTFHNTWWLPVALTLFFFSIVLSRLAPVFIMPLFYKFVAIEEGNLKEKILALTKETSMRVEGIYTFNLSKTTKKANAACTGIGKSKRIILGDTLVEKFSEDEIEVVFAHELGHYTHGHIWKGILVGTVSIFLGLFLTAQLYSLSLAWFGFTSLAQLAALPLLTLWLGLYSVITLPLSNILSRKHEYEADRYAVERTQKKNVFASAMNKLAAMNLADTTPHPLIEFLLYSHPSIEKRIAATEKL